MAILITGGAGFIGSHVVRYFVQNYPQERIINLDNLTYAANMANLDTIKNAPNYRFVAGDVSDALLLQKLFAEENIKGIIHLAAESHVDRSIETPLLFAQTNVMGTLTLLDVAHKNWKKSATKGRFYHISTDEVYGSLPLSGGLFTEETPYKPQSPYSAAKASSDHFVRAYHNTYGMDTVISNCSNNYGPYQFPEKLIPLFIHNICTEQSLPVYGTGENVRDWLYVEDHVRAIDLVYRKGESGATYNIGGNNERKNIDLIHSLIQITDQLLGRPEGYSSQLITYVEDRAGHDLRYAIDASKIEQEMGWAPQVSFEEGLKRTIVWYLGNRDWLDNISSGSYRLYNEQFRK